MTLINCEFCNHQFNALANNFFCTNCNKLNALLVNLNYFDYLGIPADFLINKQQLEVNYIKLLSVYHSDNFVLKDQKQQLNAVIHSSYLNNAYLTLKNELKAISYFYKSITKEDILSENKTINDTKFNLYIFALNEELDDLQSDNQKVAYIEKIKQLTAEVKASLSEEFKHKNYLAVQQNYIKLLYINRIKERL